MKIFSSSEKSSDFLILFFINGAKNITHAIAESFASDEMILFSFSILKHNVNYKDFFLTSVVISSFSVGEATILSAIC